VIKLNRDKSYRRHQRERIITKKIKIIKCTWLLNGLEFDQKFIGKLDKDKVHCSCKMCAVKRADWGPKDKEKSKWNQMEKESKEKEEL
jgi:hypothetical protein